MIIGKKYIKKNIFEPLMETKEQTTNGRYSVQKKNSKNI